MTQNRFDAWVRQSYPRDGVEIGLREGNFIWNFNIEVTQASENDPGVAGPLPAVIPLDAARALYESLAEMFGYTAVNTVSIRKDLDHERKRVDKFIDHLLKD